MKGNILALFLILGENFPSFTIMQCGFGWCSLSGEENTFLFLVCWEFYNEQFFFFFPKCIIYINWMIEFFLFFKLLI